MSIDTLLPQNRYLFKNALKPARRMYFTLMQSPTQATSLIYRFASTVTNQRSNTSIPYNQPA